MGAEQLYLIIGFLLGVLLIGAIMLALLLVCYEWITKKEQD